jgi:post-segregation antitoxin (ccd killing protein)
MGKAELKIEIDADLLARARDAGVDAAAVAEAAVRLAIETISDKDKSLRWSRENAEALKAQRERIDSVGVFGEDLRSW